MANCITGVTLGLICFQMTCISGCAEARKKQDNETQTASAPRLNHSTLVPEDPHTLIAQLSKRIDILEAQLAGINDKVDATRLTVDHLSESQIKTAAVMPTPTAEAGTPLVVPQSPHDPEAGFVNDEMVQTFRKAMILFQAGKYPEAILAFSSFLEKYPDHPFAGSAQFYVGEAYMKQKEYKLALQEFQRVLTSYDRSPRVSDTLSEMALAEELLKNTGEAAIHRQLLFSLFPQSPVAAIASQSAESPSHSPTAPLEIEAPAPAPAPARAEGPAMEMNVPSIPQTAPIEEKIEEKTELPSQASQGT